MDILSIQECQALIEDYAARVDAAIAEIPKEELRAVSSLADAVALVDRVVSIVVDFGSDFNEEAHHN